MATTSRYEFLLQFDGNLTDDSSKARTVNVDSGTPSYAVSDHGQAFSVSSAGLSIATGNLLESGALMGIQFNLRIATGATDGIIFAVDNGTKGVMEVSKSGTSIKTVIWNGLQSSIQSKVQTYTADTWQAWGISQAPATMYLDGESTSVTSMVNYLSDSYWNGVNDWDDRETMTWYIGKAVNTVGLTGSFGSATAASGVDLDFLCHSNDNEGRAFSKPLDTDYGVRSEITVSTPEKIVLPTYKTATNPKMTLAEKLGPSGGGGGPSAPVIKEFWS